MRFTLRSKAAESPAYRADVDGLRAIAVLSVVLYHAGYRTFSGGFVGVDIFFVISGYLITGVIEREMDLGRFTFMGFYERRMRRIFPALFAMALTCTLLAAVLFAPQQFLDFGRSLLAMTGFVSNVYFKSTSQLLGYFGNTKGMEILLHTWSLSVEEQFYLFFPILLLVLNRFAKGYKRRILVVLFLVSFAISLRDVKTAPVSAFYLLPGRAWELLLGALLASNPLPAIRSGVVRTLVGLAGLGAIAYAVTKFADGVPFPGSNALYPCLGAVLLLYAGEGGRSWVKSAMGFPPLVFIGVISYSLYLWHWPAIALTRYLLTYYWITPDRETPALVLSLVVAFLSFELIESPFRRRAVGSTPRRAVGFGIGASAAVAAVALIIVASQGLPGRFNPHKRNVMVTNYEEKTDFANIEGCANFRTELKQYADADLCEVGHAAKNIMFWGDSHTSQLYPLLSKMQAKGELNDHGLVFAVAGACPPTQHINLTQPGFHCDTFGQYAMMRAAKDDVDTVFVQFSPYWTWEEGALCETKDRVCVRNLSSKEVGMRVVEDLAASIRQLKAMGRRVIIGLPFPYYNMVIPDTKIRDTAITRIAIHMDGPTELSLVDPVGDELRVAALAAGAEIFNPRDALCVGRKCTYAIDGISLYSDQSHIAIRQLDILHGTLLKALQPQVPVVIAGAGARP